MGDVTGGSRRIVGEPTLIVAPDREVLPKSSSYSVRNLRQCLHLGKSISIFLPHLEDFGALLFIRSSLTRICMLRGAPSGPGPEPTRLAVSAPRTHIF